MSIATVERQSGVSRRLAGFTLIELLIVLGIIALLLGILLPSINKVREHARLTACSANLRSLGQCLIMYANDFKDRLPNDNVQGDWVSYASSNAVMVDFYKLYVKAPATFWCPSDNQPRPRDIVTADQTKPDSARGSFEFFSLWFAPEYGPFLTKLKGRAPLAWDVDGGGTPTSGRARNHNRGGNVVFADGHAEWEPIKLWADVSWPTPAPEFYPLAGSPIP